MLKATSRRGEKAGVTDWRQRLPRPIPHSTFRTPHLIEIVALLLGWRLILLLVAAVAAQLGREVTPPEGLVDLVERTLARWDAGWYLSIAEGGYSAGEAFQVSNVAFYPLLPALIRLARVVVPTTRGAGALVVHAALLGALVYLHALVRLDYDRGTAGRAVAFVLFFPTALFLGAIYTESLLLLTIIAAVYHARRGQWWLAGCWGAAAALSKMIGALVLVPLVWEWGLTWWRGRRPGLEELRVALRGLPALALPILGALAYPAYLHLRFGSFGVYLQAQQGFYRRSFFRPFFPDGLHFLGAFLRGEENSVVNYFYPQGATFPSPGAFMTIDLLFLLVTFLIGLALCLKVRASYGLFTLGVLGVTAFSGSPQSSNRYVLIAFPLFIAFALAGRRPVANFAFLTLGGTLLVFFTFLFVNGFWAG